MNAADETAVTAPGLFWVKGEIEQSLTRARQHIELAIEAPDPKPALQQAMAELDQVRGTATLVQSHAVSLLAGELRLTLDDLHNNAVKDCEAAYADVLAALVQLGDYVDAVAAGLVDCALVLQPALNELRVIRGQGVISEAEMFADQIAHLDLGPSPPPSDARKAGAALAAAKKYLPAFRHALLGWLRGMDPQAALGRIGRIAEELAGATVNVHLYQYWRGQSAAVEALLTKSMDDRLEVKRLIGRAGGQIKLLADEGEPAAASAVSDLTAQMLFYLGRSQGQGPRVTALRKAYELDQRLPSAEDVEALRSRIRGANTTLLEKLSDEIRRDLGEVKDAIDLAVRAGDKAVGDLTPVAQKIQRIAATLSLLGLAALQRVMQNQAPRLLELQGQRAAADDPKWLDLATAILRVEHSLDDALFRQLRGHGGGTAELEMHTPHGRDLREGVSAVLRESLVNLSKLKTQVDAYLKSGDLQQVAEAERLLGEVESSLRVMGEDRAAAQTRKLRAYAASAAFAGMRGDARAADRFADAIAGVEMLLEAIQRGDPGTENRVEALAGFVERISFDPDAPLLAASLKPADALPSPAPAVAVAEIDPEFRDIFLEEAGDVRAQLDQQLPAFKRDPQNRERLGDLRRAFHTLKGSGRMVGAAQIGEFGWALENLLNRCLEGALEVTPAILVVVEDAVALLPQMIESFREQREAPAAMAELIARAQQQVQPAEAAAVDHEIYKVFHEDARERLDVLTTWLSTQTGGETAVDKGVLRSLHTLRGSAGLAQADSISRVSGAWEQYLDSLLGADLALPAEGVAALQDFAAQLPAWIALVDGRSPQPDAQPWLARIETLQGQVPVSAVEAAEGRQLAEMFAHEAFSELEAVEHAAKSWAQQPDAPFHARSLQALFQKLHGAAASSCPPLSLVAQAFENRLTEFTSGKRVVPDSGFFANLAEIIEGMYQQLDAFREGSLGDDGSALAARVYQLESEGGGLPATPAAAEEVIEMPAVEEAGDEADLAPAGEFRPGSDPELVAIFVAEGEELLTAFDRSLDLWERDPQAEEPPQELRRVLHTLKGSSRMAGLMGIGAVAQRLETYMPVLQAGPDALLLGRLHRAADGLHALLNEVRVGQSPDASALLAELEGDTVQSAASDELPIEEEVIDMPAVAMDAEPARARAAPTAVDMQAAADAELAEIFAGEAAELIESLEHNLQIWQADPAGEEARREIQRALHTLKGGARMAGLDALGDASHAMEGQIEAIERGERAADAAVFAELNDQLTQIQRLQDQLTHRDAVQLPTVDTTEPRIETYDLPAAAPAAEAETPARAASPPSAVPGAGWDPQLFWKPEDEQARLAALRRETARVAVESLDSLLNQAGEISIYRSRLEQHNSTLRLQLGDLQQTLTRLRDQLRNLELETEAQIAARGLVRQEAGDRYGAEFDPLEMDRYSRMQELARALSESLNDIGVLQASMDEGASEAETLLLQQGRLNTEVQTGLMSTLMVPFSRQVARLHRVVTQVAEETGKQAEIKFAGVEAELDRKVLERMTAPLEHLLRNAVVHGLEDPAGRAAAGKSAVGRIDVTLRREGTQLAIEVDDDGRGLDYAAIRRKAIERGRMREDEDLRDAEVALFIFDSGFSTAKTLTQSAGRGVGMDVVAAEVKQLGGTLDLASEPGKGARFLIRLPLSLAAAQALLVGAGTELYAVPLASIEGITRIARDQLPEYERADGPRLAYGDNEYRVRRLADLTHAPQHEDAVPSKTLPAIMVRLPEGLGGGERRLAVVVDHLYGNREVVSKAVGPQVSSVQGITGATILPDGRVVLILDIPALALERGRLAVAALEGGSSVPPPVAIADTRMQIMVVDDSITIRRVTERLLDRAGYRVLMAKDGLDAIAQLQTETPAAILLDIEMPRADGFEVANFIRNHERIARTPILMITSRSGDKHRNRAKEIGVDRYLIKPFQEEQLLHELRSVLPDGG